MTADQDGVAFYGCYFDLSGLRVTETVGAAFVEHGHDIEIELAHTQCPGEQVIDIGRIVGKITQQFMDFGVNRLALLIQAHGVVGVSCHPFDAVKNHRPQANHIGADGFESNVNAAGGGLLLQSGQFCFGNAGCRATELVSSDTFFLAGSFIGRAKIVADFSGLVDQHRKAV